MNKHYRGAKASFERKDCKSYLKHRQEFEKYKTLADELETNKEAILVRERYIADIMLRSNEAPQVAKRMDL